MLPYLQAEAASGEQSSEDDVKDGNATETAKPTFKEETRTRKKILRTALKVEGPGLAFPALPAEALKASLLRFSKPIYSEILSSILQGHYAGQLKTIKS